MSTATASPGTSTATGTEGATIVVDGPPEPDSSPGGRFLLGTSLFTRSRRRCDLPREIFGPVLAVVRANDLDEGIALVNGNSYANGTAIFTHDGGAARRFHSETEAGMVGVNVPIPVPVAYFSFGGWEASLFGDLHVYGLDGVNFYTRNKSSPPAGRTPVDQQTSTSGSRRAR